MENLKGKNTWESESPERKMLYDFYTMDRISFDTENFEEYDEDDFSIAIDGKYYRYEMNLSSEYNDDECCRVEINGEYYYFG